MRSNHLIFGGDRATARPQQQGLYAVGAVCSAEKQSVVQCYAARVYVVACASMELLHACSSLLVGRWAVCSERMKHVVNSTQCYAWWQFTTVLLVTTPD